MNVCLRLLLACFLTGAWNPLLRAQAPGEGIHVQIGLGAATYTGDLLEKDLPIIRAQPYTRLGLSVVGKGWLQPSLSVGFGNIVEQYDDLVPPNHPGIVPTNYIKTNFTHLDGQLYARVFRKHGFRLGLGAGLGLLFFTPRNLDGDFLSENPFTRLPEEEYPGFTVSFPLTASLGFRLAPRVGLDLRYTYRPTQTDYLDNIGLLGRRPGNDHLHSLSAGFWIELRPPERPVSPSPQPLPLQKPIVDNRPETERPTNPQKEGSLSPSQSPEAVEPGIDFVSLEEEALQARRYRYHRVQQNDNLNKLARQYHVRIQTLRRINFLVNDELKPGSLLRIPDIQLP